MRQNLFILFLVGLVSACHAPVLPGEAHANLGESGAWCWFSDPRATYFPGEEGPKLMTGWVSNAGDIVAAQVDLNTQEVRTQALWRDFEQDDHDNPAFVLIGDQEILAQYTKHGPGELYQNRATLSDPATFFAETQTIDVIDSTELERFPRRSITYANPFCLQAENNRLYSFGRWVGFKPSMIWSDDGGQSWSKAKVLITTYPFDPGNRPYAKYYSDGQSRIHITFTDGHPRVEPTNSVYYAYYENDNFYKADGSLICSVEDLPFTPEQATLVYRAQGDSGKAWIFDIAATTEQEPVIAYTRYPDDSTHLYHYATYQEGAWMDQLICDSGPWFPHTPSGKTEPEPNYSAGLSIHPGKVNTLYLSRRIEGTFEIEKWTTLDRGQSWQSQAITQGSEYDQVRPYVPRNFKPGYPDVVLWMQNKYYYHYTEYNSTIKYAIQ